MPWLSVTKHVCARLILLLGSLVVVGCGTKQPAETLGIAAHAWPGYQFLFLARDEGLLQEQVSLHATKNSKESIKLLREGVVQAAGLTLDEALQLRDQGLDLLVPLIFNISEGADTVLAQAYIDSAEALRGKRLGLEKTPLAAIVLDYFLRDSGLQKDDLALQYIDLVDHVQQFELGNIDALITFQPVTAQLQAGGAKRLFDSRQMPDASHHL